MGSPVRVLDGTACGRPAGGGRDFRLMSALDPGFQVMY
jgi:hypothetical protein